MRGGTKEGAAKAVETKRRLNPDVFREYGSQGGKARHGSDVPYHFEDNKAASAAGSKGAQKRWAAYYKAHPEMLKKKIEREKGKR